MIEYFHQLLFAFTQLLTWRDLVEIIFFWAIIYHFSLWLKKDRQKNLLGYFYAYCALVLCAYSIHLSLATYILCLFCPVALMLFIMLHQTTLQKNFVTLRNILPAHKDNDDWIDILIRSCLIAVNNNKEIYCIIEYNDNLESLIETPISFNAAIKEELLGIVFESHSFDQRHMLWINAQGKLLGINAHWKQDQQVSNNPENTQEQSFNNDALIRTEKSDALVFHIEPSKRTFDIICQGKLFKQVHAGNALPFIKKYLVPVVNAASQGDKKHASQSKKYSSAQRNS